MYVVTVLCYVTCPVTVNLICILVGTCIPISLIYEFKSLPAVVREVHYPTQIVYGILLIR